MRGGARALSTMRIRSFHDNAGKTSLHFKIMYNKWRLGKASLSSARLTAQLSPIPCSKPASPVAKNPSVHVQIASLRDFHFGMSERSRPGYIHLTRYLNCCLNPPFTYDYEYDSSISVPNDLKKSDRIECINISISRLPLDQKKKWYVA